MDKDKIIADYIKEVSSEGFTWGTHDCVTFGLTAIGLCLNEDLMSGLPPWSTEKEAGKAISTLGDNLNEAGNVYLPTVGMSKVSSPQLGDIAIATIKGEYIFFLCINDKTMCAFGHKGIIFTSSKGEFWRHEKWEQ